MVLFYNAYLPEKAFGRSGYPDDIGTGSKLARKVNLLIKNAIGVVVGVSV